MGYELTRFVDQVDEEYICLICYMVLENPLQLFCEHLFCSDCIRRWLLVQATCPVDRQVVRLADIKPIPRYFRNMLNKLQVRCEFESQGCQEILPLENRANHLTSCNYRPDAILVCDKGCNITMTRREYQESCATHMANKLDEMATIVELLRRQVETYHNEISRLQEETRRISDLHSNSNRSSSSTRSIWKVSHNMRISSDQPHVYEIMDSGSFSWAFAQLSDPLTSVFKIRVLSIAEGGYVMVGLTRLEHPVDELPGRKVGSIGFYNRGEIVVNGTAQVGLQSWKNGDTIECRVIRTNRFIIPESEEIVVVEFSLNGAIVSRKTMTQLREGLFPTIRMGTFTDSVPKIEYL